jgi:predicted acylesterase/phospholipase RssA
MAVGNSDRDTLYICVIQGGGNRVYGSSLFANLLFDQMGIDQTKLFNYFDVISGASAGSFLAAGMATGVTPSTVANFFLDQGPWIFSTSSVTPSVQATWSDVLFSILSGTPPYSNLALVTALGEQFGSNTLTTFQTNVLIPAFIPTNPKKLVTFSNNTNLPFTSGASYQIADVLLAAAALPIYLPSVTLIEDSNTYQDGGIWANHPLQLAISYGKKLKPFASRIVVLSLGNGTGDYGFDGIPPDPPPYTPGISATFELISDLLGAPNIGATLYATLEASIPLPPIFYYEYNFVVDTTIVPNSTDNTQPATYEYLAATAESIFESDAINIQQWINHFNA